MAELIDPWDEQAPSTSIPEGGSSPSQIPAAFQQMQPILDPWDRQDVILQPESPLEEIGVGAGRGVLNRLEGLEQTRLRAKLFLSGEIGMPESQTRQELEDFNKAVQDERELYMTTPIGKSGLAKTAEIGMEMVRTRRDGRPESNQHSSWLYTRCRSLYRA